MISELEPRTVDGLGEGNGFHLVGLDICSSVDFLTRLESAKIKMPDALFEAVAKRKVEYLAGRYCAQVLFSNHFAFENVEVTAQSDRAPEWPKGFVGSITHTNNWVACAAGRRNRLDSIGIDAEETFSISDYGEIRSNVFSKEEQNLIGSDLRMATLMFTFKEAFYKCFYPLTKKVFGFETVEITKINTDENIVKFQLSTDSDPAILANADRLEIRFAQQGTRCLCVVVLKNSISR